jgi:thiamine biosynthesis lipoprotein
MHPICDSISRSQPFLGTFVEITVAEAAPSDMEAAVEAAFQTIAKTHRLMSFHTADSDVGRLNRTAAAEAVSVDAWTFQVLEAALELERHSAGMFDIAIAPRLQDHCVTPGWNADQMSNSCNMQDRALIELLPDNGVRFRDSSVKIDLGGIAKGFAVDRAVDVLREFGMPCGLVNAGGDLAAFGSEGFTVDIRDPRNASHILSRVELINAAIASSGGELDPFRSTDVGAPAIIDPASLERVSRVYGATVRAPSCLIADALTKIVMISAKSSAPLLKRYGASALFAAADGDIYMTPGWLDATPLAA